MSVLGRTIQKVNYVTSLYANGASSSVTGTLVETALFNFTIPRNTMDPRDIIRIKGLTTQTNSANTKTLRLYFGGLGGALYKNIAYSTTASSLIVAEIVARGTTNSQIGFDPGITHGVGAGSSGCVTSAIDMTQDQDVIVTGQLSDAGEVIGIEAMHIIHLKSIYGS